MSNESANSKDSLWSELITIIKRGWQVWELIPGKQRGTLCIAVVLMAVGGVSNTAIPLLLGRMVDTVKDAGSSDSSAAADPHLVSTVGWFLAMIGLAYLLREVLQVARRYFIEDTCTRLQQHLFVTLIGHLLMADLTTLSHEKIGSLHGRMCRSVTGSVKFLRVGFLDFLPAFLSGGLALSAVFAKQPWLGLTMMGVIPISLTITALQLMSQKGVRLDLMRCQEEMDGTVVEQLGGIDAIRVSNTHQREVERVTRSAEHLRSRELRHHFVMSLYGSSKAIGEGMIHIAVLGAAVYFAATGRISFGDILTYSMLFQSVMAPLNEVHRVIDEGHESSLLVAELLTFLSAPADCSFQADGKASPVFDHNSSIRIDNLDAGYTPPEGEFRQVLNQLSMDIKRGSTVGIAGRSGSGKTTLVRVLLRLSHPMGGNIQVGNVSLDSLSREDVARMIGYVGQTPFVFSGTIAENISYDCPDASPEQIRQAACLAGLDDEIMQMPGGYDAYLTERGQNLSGGQRQRLALARIFLKDPPIMILDEATSALDTISERRIQEALADRHGDHTVILVAHRLTTLKHTDAIFVFEEGVLVETGTYDELLARDGVFTKLVQSANDPVYAAAAAS